MNKREIVEFVENKSFSEDERWFLHATGKDIDTIKKIIDGGILCAHLMNTENSVGCNGQYYISLYKNDHNSRALRQRFEKDVKFIVHGIKPHYAKREKKASRLFYIDTRIPLRTSDWDGEYQQYLRISPDKFIGIDYQLSLILSSLNADEIEDEITFLKSLSLYLKNIGSFLPIYDLASHKEIDKDKVLSIIL